VQEWPLQPQQLHQSPDNLHSANRHENQAEIFGLENCGSLLFHSTNSPNIENISIVVIQSLSRTILTKNLQLQTQLTITALL
jgi:hypothetical protein